MNSRSGPAPALDCARCGHTIGRTADHYLIAGQVACSRCVDRDGVRDDVTMFGTRAAVAFTLGLWPSLAGTEI